MAEKAPKTVEKASKMAESGCIRVLHFVSTLSRGSGVMSVIMNYYRHMDRDKVQFDFLHFVSCEDSYAEEIRTLGGKICLVEKPGSSFRSVKKLEAFFQKHAREYVWLHNHEVYLTFLLRPISKRYGLEKFIVHCHATKYSDKPLNALRNRFLCLPIRFMKVERFACSEAAGKFLYGEKMVRAGKIFIMHNAINCENFKYRPEVRERLRKEMGLEGKFVIGHVGRFERQKNHEFLIEVFAEVKKRRPESVLLLVGEGSLRAYIECKVQSLCMEASVIFYGQSDNVADLYQVMDLFILPSLYEGAPVSLVEAQLNGLFCIVSDAITKESNYSSRVLYLPLHIPEKLWADSCINAEHNRSLYNNSLNIFPDIELEASKVKVFYET